MPKDVEARCRELFGDEAEEVIEKFSLYFAPDWSEASQQEIDSMLQQAQDMIRK